MIICNPLIMLNNTTHRMCVCAYRWFMSKIQRVSLYTWQEMFIFFSLFRMFNPLPIRNQSAIDVRKKISIYDVYASISRHNVRRESLKWHFSIEVDLLRSLIVWSSSIAIDSEMLTFLAWACKLTKRIKQIALWFGT